MQAIDEINNNVLGVFRETNDRLYRDIESLRNDLKEESRQHTKTKERLYRAVALSVLTCRNLSQAGKRAQMLPVYVLEFVNFLNPQRDASVQMITAQDAEWAEKILATHKANFDQSPQETNDYAYPIAPKVEFTESISPQSC